MSLVKIERGSLSDLRCIAIWHGLETPKQAVEFLVERKLDKLKSKSAGSFEKESTSSVVATKTEERGGFEILHKINGDLIEENGLESKTVVLDLRTDFSFTEPFDVMIHGQRVLDIGSWTDLMAAVLFEVKSRGIEGKALLDEHLLLCDLGDTVADHNYYYSYYRNIDMTLTRQKPKAVWNEIARLAEKWGFDVAVAFSWKDHGKACYPGRKCNISIKGSKR